MRPRTTTIGLLGRAPARAGKDPLLPSAPPPSEPGGLRRWLRGVLLDNLALKFLSLVLAVTVFLMVNTERDRVITERVALSYAMPGPDKVLVGKRVDEVRVTLKGSPQRLRKISKLDPINLDLQSAPSGDVPITPDMISLPGGLEVVDITPRTVEVKWDERGVKKVEVSPVVGEHPGEHPQHGYVVSDVKIVPAMVEVRGAKGTLATLPSVQTTAIPVAGRAASFTIEASLVPQAGLELDTSNKVMAHVTIDEELVSHKLPTIPISVRGSDGTKWQVSPPEVDITLTGALLAIEKAKVMAFVKLAPGEVKAREVDVSVEGVPPGLGIRLSPERVRIDPVKQP
jgi:YbbR domain-containing protein